METFDVIVVGRGLMGTAAARWLSEAGRRVALVGPDEPTSRAGFSGPFASHHDAARITRRVAHDPVWSALSQASIARYRDLEAHSGVGFFHEVGAMMAARHSPGMTAFAQGLERSAADLGTERMDAGAARGRFGFCLAPDSVISYEATGGGWIDPRAMRRAHETLALRAGARVIAAPVLGGEGQSLRTQDQTLGAPQILWATGGYARTDRLLPRRPKMHVYARTIAFAQVAGPIPEMPSLIWVPEDLEDDLYMLPPVRYPDGRWLMKVGGEIDSPLLESDAEMTAWFQGAGRAEAGARLLEQLRRLLPEIPWLDTHTEPCAVSFTATGYPYIARIAPGHSLLTGGNGAGAKCADELGRLGAEVAMGGAAPGFEAVFD